ncbi:defensin J1-1-like [Hibiscus syriacus]|uniref:defensin J1-1-like n=1 Tax=Hibiscus syriacus TaxID=106335 RepID=UPI00192047F5|nr:defensin J1-1-like [Hibiscus syriacus]
MERFLRSVSAAFLLLLLLLASAEMGPMVVEGRICESHSEKYQELTGKFLGLCLSSRECSVVCVAAEDFEDGKCKGFISRCVCSKKC